MENGGDGLVRKLAGLSLNNLNNPKNNDGLYQILNHHYATGLLILPHMNAACVHRVVLVTVLINLPETIPIFSSCVHIMVLLTVMMSLLSFVSTEARLNSNGLQSC